MFSDFYGFCLFGRSGMGIGPKQTSPLANSASFNIFGWFTRKFYTADTPYQYTRESASE